MTATMQATVSAIHIATTRDGGTINYQAEGVTILDALAGWIIFFVVLCWGAAVNAASNDNVITAIPLPEPCRRPNATPAAIGWIWARHYIKAVVRG